MEAIRPAMVSVSTAKLALRIDDVEQAIVDLYKGIELSEGLRLQTEQVILEQIADLRENADVERHQLVSRQRRALDEWAKLLEAQYADALPSTFSASNESG